MVSNFYFDLTALQQTPGIIFNGGKQSTLRILKQIVHNSKKIKIHGGYFPNIPIDPFVEDLIREQKITSFQLASIDGIYKYINKFKFHRFYSGLPYNLDASKINTDIIFLHIHGLRYLECNSDDYEHMLRKGWINSFKILCKKMFPNFRRSMVFDSYKKILSNQDKSIFIVPSLHTKYSLLNYYEIDSPKNIRVVYSPLTKKTLLEPSNSISSVLNYRYLLLPSAGLWNKNPIRAIKAFTNAYKKLNDPNIRLVLTGAAILRDLPCFNPKTMIALDYVQDNDMQVLYANAYAIFYPSLNEGFGYPPLEGMKYGKPVLASAVTSITEICGDAALYFNPYDINEISNRILQIFLEVSLYLNLRFKSKSQYQFVSNKSDHLCQKLCQELVNS